MNKKRLMYFGVVLVAVTMMVIFIFPISTIASVVTIDINPGVKLSLDDNDIVVSVKAMNEDAETLILDDIVGLDVETAVELIVIKAIAAGFVNEDDLEEDYVLISTVNMKNKDKSENLRIRIEQKIGESETLQGVNVAIIKATKVEMREAENKKVPMGLYVINGEIEVEGEMVSVKSYFSNSKNLNKFKEKGTVVEMQQEKKKEQFMKFLERAEKNGEDVSEYKEALNQPGFDLDEMIKDVKKNTNQGKSEENKNKSDQKGNSDGKGNSKGGKK